MWGRSVAIVGLAAGSVMSAGSARMEPDGPARVMGAAAAALLQAMEPAQRTRCALAFDATARTDWHFVPRERAGVSLGEMNDAQRVAARELLRAGLSAAGVMKIEQIMELDGVLRELERASGGTGAGRDPLAYSVAVFGAPGTAGGDWGWKFEGHHVSLNFTVVRGREVAVTPSFLGANPAEVRSGPLAGRRAMAEEEDLARALLGSLSEAQRREAVIAAEAPGDILTMPGRGLDGAPSAGIAWAALGEEQRAALWRLIGVYAGTLERGLAAEQLERIRGAGLERIRFGWAGGAARGEGHYYRIAGPTFVIEYDNTQGGANHVHTVWHDVERDFGRDLLREHYGTEHHHE